MSYRSLPLVLVALALALFVGGAVVAAEKSHDGKVVKAGDGKLTMTDKDGKEHSHTVAANAVITIDGKAAKLEDLKAGQMITVTTTEDLKQATKIVAKSQ